MEELKVGYVANLYDNERQRWTVAYGYIGSYYTKFKSAHQEIAWLMGHYSKYTEWAIERIFLDDGRRVQCKRAVVLCHSKNADVWSLQGDRDDFRGGDPAYD